MRARLEWGGWGGNAKHLYQPQGRPAVACSPETKATGGGEVHCQDRLARRVRQTGAAPHAGFRVKSQVQPPTKAAHLDVVSCLLRLGHSHRRRLGRARRAAGQGRAAAGRVGVGVG